MLVIIRTYKPDRIELARWGFWPEEWKRSTLVRLQINAHLETAAEKPMFASSFRGCHSLVLADGYYEWRTAASTSACQCASKPANISSAATAAR
jgi:putative SOS response-associated peptidase YedK